MRAFPAALAAAALICGTPLLADTLVDNVEGISPDAKGNVTRFNAILIGNDGRIAQVLSRYDKRPGKVDYRVDGKGQVVIPGLIDAHLRLTDYGFAALVLDLSAARTTAEAQARVAAYAAAHPDRPWILGTGWNPPSWDKAQLPTAADLDAAAGGRPVWIASADGLAGWASSAALKAARIVAATADPAGGRIVRLGATTAPSGVLLGNARSLVDKAVPPPRAEDRDVAFLKAQQLLVAKGITAVTAMGATIEDWQAWRRAGDSGALRIRILAYADGVDNMALIGGPGPSPWLYDDRLKLNGVVFALDGSLAARTALLKAPYADAPTARGLTLLGDTALKNLMSRAAFENFQVAVTANGDAAAAQVLDAIEAIADTYKGDRRWRIEQAGVIDPADLPRLARAGLIASVQPQALAAGRKDAELRLGTARLGGAFAWNALAANAPALALGSAAPNFAPDPFAGITAAITRQGPDGEPFGGWQPEQRLTREAALAGYTAAAAFAGFAEGRFGRITVGQRADFLILDRDPLLATPEELRGTRVLQTWIGGQLAYQADDQSAAPPRPVRGENSDGR
ncbi:MAG: amidohydrolase family protein [Novosphingobium sp.]